MKEIELLNCHAEKPQRAMILTTPINGIAHQIFFNQQNVPGLLAEKAGGVVYGHNHAKFVVRGIEVSVCTEEIPDRVSSDNNSEGLRCMDPISKVFCENFEIQLLQLLAINQLQYLETDCT